MKEIVEIGLKNYQSHKDTVIQVESGFNVIIGPSDSGKTAIKRGVESVLYNRYTSKEDIRDGEKYFSNYVLFNDGLKITREKGGKLNKYIIDYPDGSQEELNNFGTGVPPEVMHAHGMYLVELGKEMDSLNCAYQLSGPFFLQNTAGQRAAIIGSIAKTQVIDEAVSNTLSKHREQKKSLKALEKTNKDLEKDINTYLWLDEAKLIVEAIERDYDILSNTCKKYDTLSAKMDNIDSSSISAAYQRNIIQALDDIHLYEMRLNDVMTKFSYLSNLESKFRKIEFEENRRGNFNDAVTGYKNIDLTLDIMSELSTILNKYNSISKKIDSVDEMMMSKSKLENICSTLTGIDDVCEHINTLSSDVSRYNSLSKKVSELNALLERRQNGEKYLSNIESKLSESISKYQNMLDSLGKCPTCFGIITPEQLDVVKNSFI